jgi:hypothetical protein
MTTKLIQGLKEYNKDNKQLWTVPRKGTPPHSTLLKIIRKDLDKKDDDEYNKLFKRYEELSKL